jgi:uncharacterized protein
MGPEPEGVARTAEVKGSPGAFHLLAKPTGAVCNLDCSYCFFLSKELLYPGSRFRMAEDLLETYLRQLIEAHEVPEVTIAWQGGEPTLMGIDFFRRSVELAEGFLRPGQRAAYTIQTNGTLIDADWAAFFAEHDFLVGISIDGPRELHDAYRPTKAKKSSFDHVFAAAKRLQAHGVTLSTLSVINRRNARHPLDVYRFLRDELGTRYMQFLPCVEPRAFETTAPGHLPRGQLAPADSPRARPGHPMSIVTEWSVDPDDWGTFLSAVFDEWSRFDVGRVKVNLFESMFGQLAGKPSMLCTSSPVCGKNVAVEHDGRVYSCDHYVYPEYEIGKLGERPLAEMVFSLRQLEFGLDKHNSLPSECKTCRHLKLCWGECPRTRILRTREEGKNLSYLCAGWKRFYDHARPKISVKRRALPVVTG